MTLVATSTSINTDDTPQHIPARQQVLINPYFLAEIFKYVPNLKQSTQINRVWNRVAAEQYYPQYLWNMNYNNSWEFDLLENCIESLRNESFRSGLALVLRQRDTKIRIQRETSGSYRSRLDTIVWQDLKSYGDFP